VALGQLDRLPGELGQARQRAPDPGRLRRRAHGFGHRQVRQAGELQERPPAPAHQGNALF
jgi:hypothetical protein